MGKKRVQKKIYTLSLSGVTCPKSPPHSSSHLEPPHHQHATQKHHHQPNHQPLRHPSASSAPTSFT
ncbi:hypothetical protein AAZX31_06G210100 [Glycine max]